MSLLPGFYHYQYLLWDGGVNLGGVFRHCIHWVSRTKVSPNTEAHLNICWRIFAICRIVFLPPNIEEFRMNCWTIVDMYNNFYWFHNLCEYFYSVWRTKLIKITIIFVISNPKWVCLSTICQNVKLCYRVVQISLGCVIITDISAYKYVVIFSSDNWRKEFKVNVWIGSF